MDVFYTVQDNDLDGSELDSSNDEEWNSDSSRYKTSPSTCSDLFLSS